MAKITTKTTWSTYSLLFNTSHGILIKEICEFPLKSFYSSLVFEWKYDMSTIATWPCLFLVPSKQWCHCYIQRVAVFCVLIWSLSNCYGMSFDPNMFLKKVWHVSWYNMTCIEEERVPPLSTNPKLWLTNCRSSLFSLIDKWLYVNGCNLTMRCTWLKIMFAVAFYPNWKN